MLFRSWQIKSASINNISGAAAVSARRVLPLSQPRDGALPLSQPWHASVTVINNSHTNMNKDPPSRPLHTLPFPPHFLDGGNVIFRLGLPPPPPTSSSLPPSLSFLSIYLFFLPSTPPPLPPHSLLSLSFQSVFQRYVNDPEMGPQCVGGVA